MRPSIWIPAASPTDLDQWRWNRAYADFASQSLECWHGCLGTAGGCGDDPCNPNPPQGCDCRCICYDVYEDWVDPADSNVTITWGGSVNLEQPGEYTLTATVTNNEPPLDNCEPPGPIPLAWWKDPSPAPLTCTITVLSKGPCTAVFEPNLVLCPGQSGDLNVGVTNTGQCDDGYAWCIDQSGTPFTVGLSSTLESAGLHPGESQNWTVSATVPTDPCPCPAGGYPCIATLDMTVFNSEGDYCDAKSVTITARDPCTCSDCPGTESDWIDATDSVTKGCRDRETWDAPITLYTDECGHSFTVMCSNGSFHTSPGGGTCIWTEGLNTWQYKIISRPCGTLLSETFHRTVDRGTCDMYDWQDTFYDACSSTPTTTNCCAGEYNPGRDPNAACPEPGDCHDTECP